MAEKEELEDQQPSNLDLPGVIANRYRLVKKIGQGPVAIGYEGVDQEKSTPVAIKVWCNKESHPSLRVFPPGRAARVTPRRSRCRIPKSSARTVWRCLIAKQMITRLRSIHEKIYVRRYLVSSSLLLGPPGADIQSKNLIHLVGFGDARMFSSDKITESGANALSSSTSGPMQEICANAKERLFDEVLEASSERDDGVCDWMLLNGGKGGDMSEENLDVVQADRTQLNSILNVTQRPAVIMPEEHGSSSPPRSILGLSALEVPKLLALGAASKKRASGRDDMENAKNGTWYKSVWKCVKRRDIPNESPPDNHNASQPKRHREHVRLAEVAAERAKERNLARPKRLPSPPASAHSENLTDDEDSEEDIGAGQGGQVGQGGRGSQGGQANKGNQESRVGERDRGGRGSQGGQVGKGSQGGRVGRGGQGGQGGKRAVDEEPLWKPAIETAGKH
ncbi:hypothetical protein BS17DRAFT_833831 [Gyrodon lividus]|nr:hypothetical protein BS17DRAFT_833831 [Gyrodon lividus]